jgi:plasmid stabilization system protein ParE
VKVRFLTIAQQEVDDAFHWFEERNENLGFEFLTEIDRIVQLVRSFPFAAFEIEPEIRRALLARFPYAVVYGVTPNEIIVIAVSHTHRKPKYWIDRIE